MDRNKRRKLQTGIIAALLMLLILLTGTYAWTQFNNVGFNALDVGTNFGGRFHDNFVWENGSEGFGEGTHNKDLFAENFGENRIFVRVRLREFMTSGGVPVIAGTTIDNPLGTGVDGVEWPIYVSAPDNPHTRQLNSLTTIFERNGIEWNLGHHNDKVFMPTFNHAEYNVAETHIDGSVPSLFNRVNAYEMIEATGMAVDGHTFDITTQIEARDILTNGNQTGPGLMGHAGSDIANSTDEHGEHDYWEAGDTLSSPRLIVDETGILRVINNPDTDEPFEHIARYTLSPENPTREGVTLSHPVTNGIMTMQQWEELERPRGNFWVLDTDGWFYWASPLASEDATSLLLDEITVKDIHDEGIEYVINVEAQFTNLTHIEVAPEFDDMTEGALDLWLIQPLNVPDVAHETFQDPDTGTIWRVLVPVEDQRGGVGNALIITERDTLDGRASSNSHYNASGHWTIFEHSDLRQFMIQWFNNEHNDNVGRALRERALNYEFGAVDMTGPATERTALGAGIEADWQHGDVWMDNEEMMALPARPQAFTRPVGQIGNGEPFALSLTEAKAYFDPSPNSGQWLSNWWQLRSPGVSNSSPFRRIGSERIFTPSYGLAQTATSWRPALWIRP